MSGQLSLSSLAEENRKSGDIMLSINKIDIIRDRVDKCQKEFTPW